jgi:ribosomal protein L11 methyltransferase
LLFLRRVYDEVRGLSSIKDDRSTNFWYALDVETDSAAREAVGYALMESGSLGTETNDKDEKFVRVTGYFAQTPNRESVRKELATALRLYDLPSSSVREMSIREVMDEDWLGEWKKNWQPVKTGRFIVAPPWSEIPEASDQVVIRIEPGMAFGTGTHETTRLCLTAIEKYFDGGSLLDVGTGTGILAIAAAKFSAQARIEACDTDAEAIVIARENARLNGVAEQIVFRVGTVSDVTASADMVCANLTADVILGLLPTLLGATCGRLVLSGILDSQADAVNARLRECGVTAPTEIVHDGEWVAIVV